MSQARLASSALLLLLTACGVPKGPHAIPQEHWEEGQGPEALSPPGAERRLAQLPTTGSMAHESWGYSYWPDVEGGAAFRWQDAVPLKSYATLSPEEVATLTPERLARLSPLEKYDIYKGRYDFPSVRWVRSITSPASPEWAGLCDAMALVASRLAEPGQATVTGARGQEIPFGSSDVKGLLGHYYGKFSTYEPTPVGRRCELPEVDVSDIACRDVNPGTFHLVLAQRLGLDRSNLIIDVETNRVVFNYPIYSYVTHVGNEVALPTTAAPEARKAVEVNTVLTYAGLHRPSLERTPLARSINYLNLDYVLELDDAGRIVGGEWISVDHPDYLWTAELAPPTDYYADVWKIYEASLAN